MTFIKDIKPLKDAHYKGYRIKFERLISELKGNCFIPQIVAYVTRDTPFKKDWIQSKTCITKGKAFDNIKIKVNKHERKNKGYL